MRNVVLMADPNSNAWNFAKKIQDYLQFTKEEHVPLWEISVDFFNNREINMYVPENIRKRDIYYIQDSTKNPQQWWVELLLIKDLVLSSSANTLTFVLPNMLYSRQDRKQKSRVPISARAFAKSISKGIERIITMDLHAPQIQGFYPENIPLDNLYSFPEVVRYIFKNHINEFDKLVVVSPDTGGVNRAKSFLKRLKAYQTDPLNNLNQKEFSFALISKTRPKAGEVEDMQLVGEVSDKDVIIIDDIIDTGTTLLKAADLLKNNRAKKIFCYSTHGIFTRGTEELRKKFDILMTSNTYYQENNGAEVIDISPTFAEAIYRAQKGLSISKLFE